MPRNFDRRYELFFPILDPKAKESMLRELTAQACDDVNAWELHADGTQSPRWGGQKDAQRPDAHVHRAPRGPGRKSA